MTMGDLTVCESLFPQDTLKRRVQELVFEPGLAPPPPSTITFKNYIDSLHRQET